MLWVSVSLDHPSLRWPTFDFWNSRRVVVSSVHSAASSAGERTYVLLISGLRLHLFEAVVLQPLGRLRTPWVDVFGPEVGGCIRYGEPDGQPEPEAHAAGDAQGGAGHRLAFVVGHVGGEADAVVHVCKESAHQRAVEEVYGEGILAQPEQVLVREHGLNVIGEVDAQRDKKQSEAGVHSWEVGVLWED